jgi:hypothetical protein
VTTCTTLRFAVLLSLGLLIGGFVLLAIAESTGLGVPSAHAALVLALAAVAVLFGALIIAIWPGANERLSGCQH